MDIVEQAVSNVEDYSERDARGRVDGKAVTVLKHEYDGGWRISVFIGEVGHAVTRVDNLDGYKAQKKFQHLVEKHDLIEGYMAMGRLK